MQTRLWGLGVLSYASVSVPAPTVECRADNNTSKETSAACSGPR
jgi:hypothetical protein